MEDISRKPEASTQWAEPSTTTSKLHFYFDILAVSHANAPLSGFATMDHSTAIMEDAGHALEGAATTSASVAQPSSNTPDERELQTDDKHRENNYDRRKRKRDFSESSMQHGSRGGKRPREDHPGNDKRHQRGDMGRKAYLYVLAKELSHGVSLYQTLTNLQARIARQATEDSRRP